MTWVRVDDHFDEHPKFAKAGPLGIALWLAGLAYCNRNHTDGFIPWATVQSMLTWSFLSEEVNEEGGHKIYDIGVTSGMSGDDVDCSFVAELLIHAGLWEAVEGGFHVHDYADYQPTREQLELEKAQKQAAGQAGGRAAAIARAQAAAEAPADTPAVAESKPGPGPVPGLTTPLSPPTGGRRRAKATERKAITDDDIEGLVGEHAEQFGSALAVREEIDNALNHTARYNAVNERLYLSRWLKRELGYREKRGLVTPIKSNNGRSEAPVVDNTGKGGIWE